MSSIALNSKHSGYEAARTLDLLMRNKKIKDKTIYIRPTHVVARRSTDIVAVQDEHVSKAIQYIKKNSNMLIQVNDVCSELSISRRQLERKFRKTLKRTINQEIRMHRAEQVSKLLLKTNLTISEIAENLGFSGLHHVSRLFKSIKGITPGEYRRQYTEKNK